MPFSFSPIAANDLEEIADYIARDNPSRAVSFINELETHCHQIAELPEAYPLREDLAPKLRIAFHKNYAILFRLLEDTVRIERIVHGARDITQMIERE